MIIVDIRLKKNIDELTKLANKTAKQVQKKLQIKVLHKACLLHTDYVNAIRVISSVRISPKIRKEKFCCDEFKSTIGLSPD